MGAQTGETNRAEVSCETSQGLEVRGIVVHFARDAVAFEVYDPAVVIQTSEVLGKFKVLVGRQVLYSGRAVVGGVVHTGSAAICEAKLGEEGARMAFEPSTPSGSRLQGTYDRFFREWQSNYRIARELKVIVVDVEAFLTEVGRWLAQIESSLAVRDNGRRPEHDRELVEALAPRIIATFNSQHERFEELVCAVPPELLGVHESFVRQHWQKLFLCSPFGHRTYYKPLGYAGDYEMMNMIHRCQPEGDSLFAKLIHLLLVSQWPARSVRNRVAHLEQVILRETVRTATIGRPCRILNVGCGPAREIQDFFRDAPPGPVLEFTLVDFNEETLNHASRRLAELKHQFGHHARVETSHISVYQLLRRGAQPGERAMENRYDLIYCSGLFDYLQDETCRALVNLFYHSLEPGGLVVVANMKDDKPFRYFIEFVLDWRLIYRNAARLGTFAPSRGLEAAAVEAEETSVNLFLHVRKPA